MYQFIYVATSDEEAQHTPATRLQQTYQQPFARLVPKYCTAGTPATCRASLQAYVDAGVREFILTPPVASPHEFRRQLDLYASEIFPALRGLAWRLPLSHSLSAARRRCCAIITLCGCRTRQPRVDIPLDRCWIALARLPKAATASGTDRQEFAASPLQGWRFSKTGALPAAYRGS